MVSSTDIAFVCVCLFALEEYGVVLKLDLFDFHS